MARLIHVPDQHNCRTELSSLGKQPVGSIAECSCRKQYVMRDDQRDGPFWDEKR